MNIRKTDVNTLAIDPPCPPNDGILFVDHSKAGRSGHLGHALVEYAPGEILAFYPNCSDANSGHTGDGWMEYKRSEDGGRTWGEPAPLEYSKRMYESGTNRSVMCEKAACTNEGAILLFNLECANIAENNFTWQPLVVPTFLRSSDGGRAWEDAKPMGNEPGRIWDVLYHEGVIYVLELCNDSSIAWYGNLPKHHYSLYASNDQGHTFTRLSVLPFEFIERGYGALAFLPDSGLAAYVYNRTDEKHLDYAISRDGGQTWGKPRTAFFAKQIRNPQMAAFRDGFVMHGRSGSKGDDEIRGHFVLYTSRDGIHWDEGRYLQMRTAGNGAYSNNLLVHDPDRREPERLLVQASHAYEESKTNIRHWWLT
jgi:hypothetical protein